MNDRHAQGPVEPLATAPHPLDPAVRIGHVHLRTASIDRVRDFYVGVLGFNTWKSKDGPPQPDGVTGLHHVALLYPTRAALADAYRRLHERGWPIRQATDHGTHEAIYISDPDGNDLELAWDRPQPEWPLDELGRLKGIGGDLDLEALLRVAGG